jgi:2-oxoglutarate ferredoxin oxidoreductase subunit beta
VTEDDLLVHDESNPEQAFLLSQMFAPEFPEAMGVIYVNSNKPTYNEMLHDQIEDVINKNEGKTLQSLVTGTNTWIVE